MDLMQLFSGLTNAIGGGQQQQMPEIYRGLIPPGQAEQDQRRAIGRALLAASQRLATAPGNFGTGLASAAGEGGLSYYNTREALETQRQNQAHEAYRDALWGDQQKRVAADSDRNYNRRVYEDERDFKERKANDERTYELRKRDTESRSAYRERYPKGWQQQGKSDGPQKEDVEQARADAQTAVDQAAAEAGRALTPEEEQAIRDSKFQERLSFYTRTRQSLSRTQGILRDAGVPTAGDPADDELYGQADAIVGIGQ